MTASHYTDPRQRAVLPVGNLFLDEGTEIVPDRQPQDQGSPQKLKSNNSKIGIKSRILI
jgi:hypothetical protein